MQSPRGPPHSKMETAEGRLGAGGQNSELTRSLLTSGIGRYQINLELPRLRWGGEEKVKMAPPCEDSRGMGFFVDYYHRSRSQVMANTSDKVKEGIHDAAEKVKDACAQRRREDQGCRAQRRRRSRTPRTTLPRRPRMSCTTSARRSRTQVAERPCIRRNEVGPPPLRAGLLRVRIAQSMVQEIARHFTCFSVPAPDNEGSHGASCGFTFGSDENLNQSCRMTR